MLLVAHFAASQPSVQFLCEGSSGITPAPHQLGFGVSLGTEAAVHATCTFLHNLHPGLLIVKLDFKNAFNSLRWDKMIAAMG